MATTKYEYELSNFPNSKFNFDRLQYEIEHSEIIISIDYDAGLGGTATGGCSINFKDELSIDDKTILNTIISNHSGEILISLEKQFNSEGIQKVILKPDVDVASTWIARGNLCDPTLVLPLKWEPTSDRKLSVTQTMLIISKDVVMDATLHFKGYNTGILGNKNFERIYTNLWDYQYGCDKYYEFSDHIRMEWYYAPIVLLYSKSAKIEITIDGQGYQNGTKGVVKLICLSEIE